MKSSNIKLAFSAVAAAALLAACGGGSSDPVLVANADATVPTNATVAGALAGTSFAFPSGVPALGTTGTTTLAFATITAACATTPLDVPACPPGEPEYTLVWVGRGEAERLVDGAWRRAPEFDYDFSVQQVRYGDRWSSVKSMRRRHPDYDGSAGERTVTWFFQADLKPTDGARVPVEFTTSLGAGLGTTDPQFRRASMELKANVSSMAPFDRYRISQDYRYEDGQLDETVSLDKGETPWVRNVEHATLFARHTFAAPPTTR